jgi:hypothetical protein
MLSASGVASALLPAADTTCPALSITITLAPASEADRMAAARSLSAAELEEPVSSLDPIGYPGISEVCATASVALASIAAQITKISPARTFIFIVYRIQFVAASKTIEPQKAVQIIRTRGVNIVRARVPDAMDGIKCFQDNKN